MNAARAKVEAEGGCRVCGAPADKCDAAHTWDRSLGGPGFDDPDAVVPLCSTIKGAGRNACHDLYDDHLLDLLPYLTTDEQVALVRMAGTIERARQRAIGRGRPRGRLHRLNGHTGTGPRRPGLRVDPEGDIFGPF